MNHCKTIAIVNQKGGVGKTTSTVNLGVGLAQAGNRVLLVDDDSQHSLTISLGIRNADEDLDTTLATAMQAEIRDESVPWEEGIIHSGEGGDLLPANIELSGVEMSLFNAMSREQVLKSVLSRVKENYDYILIDCMPSLGLMSVNALVAADSVIIPSAPDFLSTKGLNLLIRTISRVRRQKPDGRYEIVSGHRRTKACELAGLTTVKAEIKELSRDEAIILMVESNLQRTTILPSEKAFSYKMRLEAMNRQGQRTDLTSSPLDNKLQGVTSAQQISDKTNGSQPQIYRYIRLTHLIPPLLDLVDSGKIAFRPAVELSYLTEEEQNSLLDSISSEQSTPSLAQALKMKEFSQNGRLNADVILSIMCEQKPNQREKISIQSERLKPFIPKNFTAKQTEDYVIKALEYYHRYQLRQKERDR